MPAKVLLITKKSLYEIYGIDRADTRFLGLLNTRSDLASDVMQAHDENRRAVDVVHNWLVNRGVILDTAGADENCSDSGYSLVVSVGGDGTLLAASHRVLNTPVLGINSRPGVSVGFFCPVSFMNFEPLLEAALDGKEKPGQLTRIDPVVNGQVLCPPALNDILFTACNPAATTVYNLKAHGHEELQKSAGIWISTPAGSTGGIMSAGGRSMQLHEQRLQFKVRECYCVREPFPPLQSGFFINGFAITNLTMDAALYVDGSRIIHKLTYGDTFEVVPSSSPLRIFLPRRT